LAAYSWPGNIRELMNIMERAVLLASENRLHVDLPRSNKMLEGSPFDDLPTLDEIQRRYINFVLDKTGGKLSGPGGAVEILGIKRTSLYNRMKKLGLRQE
ncbi:MAG: Fis family transcriptional regulator, partial [Desulfobacterales bacterium]|nr:Fis family transcriptional regulator [Desulfobacterales bacterium]